MTPALALVHHGHQHLVVDGYDWWDATAYAPFRRNLERVQSLLVRWPPPPAPAPARGGDGGLVDLAWKQLMVATYETAWHGLGVPDEEVAPWARATASHVRSALVTLEAARYQAQLPAAAEANGKQDGNGNAQPVPARVWVADIDDDGHREVIMANRHLFAVVSPSCGGRLVAAFDLTRPGGRQVVGNPADDWNWQEELNSWMEQPANHPGAFTDCGYEHTAWVVAETTSGARGAAARLRCDHGPLAGSTKTYRLGSGGVLEVEYALVEIGLSPDYLRLLRGGREVVKPVYTGRRRGFRNGECCAWVDLPAGQPVVWAPTPARPAGHVLGLRISAFGPRFRLTLGVGAGRSSVIPSTACLTSATRT